MPVVQPALQQIATLRTVGRAALSPPLVGSFKMQNLSCFAPVREHQKLLGEGAFGWCEFDHFYGFAGNFQL